VFSTTVTNEVIVVSLRYGFEGFIIDNKISTPHSAGAATEFSSKARSGPTEQAALKPTRHAPLAEFIVV
jgi:hypothetical protein